MQNRNAQLHQAVEKSDLMAMRTALAEGADVNSLDARQLSVANKAQSLEILRELLDNDDLICPTFCQTWIILLLTNLGYSEGYLGACFGMTFATIDALLIEHGFATYNARLKEMLKIVLDMLEEIDSKINWAKDYVAIYKDGFYHPQDSLLRVKFASKLKAHFKLNADPRDKANNKKIDMLATLDKIATYQKFPLQLVRATYSEQDIAASAAIVDPAPIREAGGKQLALTASAPYSTSDLTIYCQSLRELVAADDLPSIALQLSDLEHTIALGYDKLKQRWIYFDPNETQYAKTDAELIALLAHTFGATPLLISTYMFVATNDNTKIIALNKRIDHMQSRPDWKSIHRVTKEKAQFKNAKGHRWLDLAAEAGQVEMVNNLLPHRSAWDSFNDNREKYVTAISLGVLVSATLIGLSIVTLGAGTVVACVLAAAALIGIKVGLAATISASLFAIPAIGGFFGAAANRFFGEDNLIQKAKSIRETLPKNLERHPKIQVAKSVNQILAPIIDLNPSPQIQQAPVPQTKAKEVIPPATENPSSSFVYQSSSPGL